MGAVRAVWAAAAFSASVFVLFWKFCASKASKMSTCSARGVEQGVSELPRGVCALVSICTIVPVKRVKRAKRVPAAAASARSSSAACVCCCRCAVMMLALCHAQRSVAASVFLLVVPVKQVTLVPAAADSFTCSTTAQRKYLACQYLHFCTSTAATDLQQLQQTSIFTFVPVQQVE